MNSEILQELMDKEQQAEPPAHTIRVCNAAGCRSAGGEALLKGLGETVKQRGLEKTCAVKGVGCMGLCAAGPLVRVDEDRMYQRVGEKDCDALVDAVDGKAPEGIEPLPGDLPFFTKQKKVVLENCGEIDPERIEDYVAAGGYSALVKALTEMTPEQVIAEITASGLRGRGGAGFPSGLKWSTVAKAESSDGRKFVICNADEGDPGAFMDRCVLESDPHRVLEGMAIAAYAVGAQHGYIYVRAEYPLAIERLKLAIRQARKLGFLGPEICDSPFTFNVELRLGAGAFVCGEETALIASIEGKRGQPRPRPPYPASSGLWGQPTLINNVETLANIAPIVRHGGAWLAAIGTEKSKGTKVFALAGRITNTGMIEVPMGITLREIIEDMAGGIPEGKAFKAVQTGGPSGGCIPADYLDMAVDYESLAAAGSIMGSGGMIVMDETSNMVDVARYFMDFCMSESCGKCVPCRVGTWQMHELLKRILAGDASQVDLDQLVELCDMVKHTSLCGLGQTAPNPVLSTLRFFPEEYDNLLIDVQGTTPVVKEVSS